MFEPGRGTDYFNQVKIHALEENNRKLLNEKYRLESELRDLKQEVTQLAENPDYVKKIKNDIKNYENEVKLLNNNIKTVVNEIAQKNQKHRAVEKLLGTLSESKDEHIKIVAASIEAYHKKAARRGKVISFALGVLSSLFVWGITHPSLYSMLLG